MLKYVTRSSSLYHVIVFHYAGIYLGECAQFFHNSFDRQPLRKSTYPIANARQVTAYLDSTCSMPTSEALTTTKSPCYFLGPSNYIGSFKAKCSSTATNESSATAAEKGSSSTSPGLQSTPSNGAGGLTASGAMGTGGRWLEPGIRALMSMGAVEVAWGWDML